jgi:hypothetical protein
MKLIQYDDERGMVLTPGKLDMNLLEKVSPKLHMAARALDMEEDYSAFVRLHSAIEGVYSGEEEVLRSDQGRPGSVEDGADDEESGVPEVSEDDIPA